MFRSKQFLLPATLLLFHFLLMRSVAQQSATDATGILAKYHEALGGAEKFAAISTLVERGEISGDLVSAPFPYRPPSAHADHGAFEFYYKAPNLRLSVVRSGGAAVMYARGCDGNVAWYANPFQGRGVSKPKPGEPNDCDPGFDPMPTILREPGVRTQFKGTKKLGEKQAYVIHVEDPKSHRKETDYFDTSSYLLIRSEVTGWSGLSRSYSDYRDVGGIKFPFVVTQETENSKITTTLRQVELNVSISDETFKQPPVQAKQSTPPRNRSLPATTLPDQQSIAQLLLRPSLLLPLPVIHPPNSTLTSTESGGASHPFQPVVYVNATNFSSCSIPELVRTVPELRDLKVGQSSDLSGLLDKVGRQITEMYRKMPNLIAHEDVVETDPNHPPSHRHFSYLILSHTSKDAVTLEEFRMDPQGGIPDSAALMQKPSTVALSDLRARSLKASNRQGGELPLSQGFANMWTNFYPSNRAISVFRYLGSQKIDRHNTLVLAFSQRPALVLMPGKLLYRDTVVSLYFQGIAWVDESDFRIVRLRTDLLSPPADVPLYQLTAEIHFMDVPVGGFGTLWLPHQVEITSDLNSFVLKDRHVYTDYRLFGVKSRIRLDP